MIKITSASSDKVLKLSEIFGTNTVGTNLLSRVTATIASKFTSDSYSFDIEDTNSDGVCSLKVVSSVDFAIRKSNGKKVYTSSGVTSSITLSLPEGSYSVEYV